MTESLVNLYRQAEDYFFCGISLKCLKLGDAAAYMAGIPVADFNIVYIEKEPSAFENILLQSKQFYDQENLPFVIVIPQSFCKHDMQNDLKAHGYSQIGSADSMFVKINDLSLNEAFSFDDGTTIQANDHQLNDWMMPLIEAFASTHEMCLHYANTHEAALKNKYKFHHFSLYKEEIPIASITLSLHGTIARIDDVGTLPEFQGKGYATRLINFVLSLAAKSGVKHCFLESSGLGLSIYQKLGFKILFKNNIYTRDTLSCEAQLEV